MKTSPSCVHIWLSGSVPENASSQEEERIQNFVKTFATRIYFFKRGELINYVTLDQIIRDNSKLRRTVSHYHWANFEGLDQAGRCVVETVEGRKIRFDVATGTPVAGGSRQSLPEKTKTPRP
jgi:hypothetical protein